MLNFDFEIKTKLYFGKGRHLETGKILSSFNAKKVLIIIGQGSVRKNGLLGEVIDTISAEKISFHVLEGVRPNPTIDLVKNFLKFAKEYQPDFILAIGGGSVIDTAKSICVGYYYDGDSFDFNLKKAVPNKSLPLGVILTISASGSEMSTSCVIQDDKTMIKCGFNSEYVRPTFAIENPELTYSVNKEQTAYGIVDILMHTLERYFTKSDEYELADEFALGLLKNVIDVGLLAFNNPDNYEYRARLMLAGSLSHNGYTSVGKKYLMPVHQLEHALSGLHPEVAHGEGLAILWPAWARYYLPYDVEKFNSLSENVFDSHLQNKLENAEKGISLMEEFFISLNIPHKLSELKTKESISVDALADRFSNGGTRVVAHHEKPMDREVAREIYTNCF